MNKKYFVSGIILVVALLLTSVASAYHRSGLLQAQVASTAKTKQKSNVAVQVERLRQAYYKAREAEGELDWEGGPPEPNEVQPLIDIVNEHLRLLKNLTPVTSKDKKAHNRFFKELAQEAKSLGETLLQGENDNLHEANRDNNDMEEDCWGDASTCVAKIKAFEETLALWQAFQAKAANLNYKRLAREANHEINVIQENIKNIQKNIDEAQRHATERAAEQSPDYIVSSPTYPQPDEGRVRDYFQTNPLAICSGLSYEDCGLKMESFLREGGNPVEIARWLVSAGAVPSTEEALLLLKKLVNKELGASVYRIYRRYLR